jgi:hypothetical protein
VPVEVRGGGLLPMPRRVTMPGRFADHGLAAFAGRVQFIRKFGYPGRIDDYERVWLTCDGFDGTAAINLNQAMLASNHVGPFAFDVTANLRPHNLLTITLDADSDRAGLWGEVALEIRCSAYLRDLVARRLADGVIEITGAVVGSAEQPLELYTLTDGAHADYRTIEATREGTPFHVVTPRREPPVQLVRVDLVNVSTVWYAWEIALP